MTTTTTTTATAAATVMWNDNGGTAHRHYVCTASIYTHILTVATGDALKYIYKIEPNKCSNKNKSWCLGRRTRANLIGKREFRYIHSIYIYVCELYSLTHVVRDFFKHEWMALQHWLYSTEPCIYYTMHLQSLFLPLSILTYNPLMTLLLMLFSTVKKGPPLYGARVYYICTMYYVSMFGRCV